ncbi:MaoC family dehydratase N-terminal domain-containing protein [Dasania sp. GY-MA-18]|uniref:MaoC/PaaZ C-terminal domain-containing protein n=1 Tax=Dasania phycosphaerae TaxID=2950436 RepID=A0A9J6RNR3_9GAMM|nr:MULTISPECIES: MaoC/PaaZ C-terminal domain-containing protein [Dasania]MCR8923544.1 MaoC family dehydratase N-terminal domain-containing protein [Dasania sp. GY-MA-18]MCZ0865978.1 MaoC/PaaZ C-terminal domain-containing protein [Dasania phycosphaerae]MCZ0869702.1 MaoC/PaaZ C-terminal domain-containing protein [Dasania phycosphaerae]
MSQLSNFTYDEISIGQTAEYSKTLTEQDIVMFAATSGDTNPVHLDEAFAASTPFQGRIAHGMWTGGLVSAAIALHLPGPGSIYLGQSLSFRKPVMLGDQITVNLEVTDKQDKRRTVVIKCVARNQDNKIVAQGEATVMAPDTKLNIPKPVLPSISIG